MVLSAYRQVDRCYSQQSPIRHRTPITHLMNKFRGSALVFTCCLMLWAQDQSPPSPSHGPGAGTPGVSAGEVAAANNPLANLNSVSFQNLYDPTLFGVSGVVSNTLNVRGVIVSGRQIIRFTLPVSTVPAGRSTIDLPGGGSLPSVSLPIGPVRYRSGFGDANIFDSILLTGPGASTNVAIGPQFVAPTSTNSSLGSGKWQAGVAGILVHPLQGGSMLGALITWQHSFAGDKDRPTVNVGAFQPFLNAPLGGGYYLKSSPIWTFDFNHDLVLIPWGLGIGRVFRMGNAIANANFEPQFSVYHKGQGLPAVQLVFGLAFQWKTK
jgi:hypothetical protein